MSCWYDIPGPVGAADVGPWNEQCFNDQRCVVMTVVKCVCSQDVLQYMLG